MVQLLSFCLFAIFSASLLFAQNHRRVDKMDPFVHRAAQRDDGQADASAQAIRRMARPRRKAQLKELAPEHSRPVSRKVGLVPVGVRRSLPEDVLAQGEWSTSPNGSRVWRLALQSTGAQALRVRFTQFHVGTGNVWLLGGEADGSSVTAGPYTGDGLFGDGDFWSDIVAGDLAIIAYEPAPDSAPDTVPFKLVAVSHRLGAVRAGKPVEPAPLAAAASCAIDVACFPEYSEPASAVALMIFESEEETYECSGSLINSGINSASQSTRPFFLTANHCISTADEAKSLITLFNYQTPSCNGKPPSISNLPRVVGASYLAGQGMGLGDFSLLQLNAFPNVDVKVLGWTSEEIAADEQVTGISHPLGDYKRIALGRRTRDVTIRFSDGERMPANKGYQVTWFQGVTQSGSSGSPLLATIGGKQYLVGTLSAGPNVDEDNSAQVCRPRNLIASYGRFSAAFPYLESSLTSNTTPVRQGVLTSSRSAGITTLSWQATGVTQVQIRVNSPTGPAMTGLEPPTGSAVTGTWVSNGMIFYLQNASDGDSSGAAKTLATVRVSIASDAR